MFSVAKGPLAAVADTVNRAQTGVLIGMALALAATVGLFAFGLSGAGGLAAGASPTLELRIRLALGAALGPLACLAVAIGFIANRRFFSGADIDGAVLTEPTPPIRIARAILENTAEQTLLAVPVYAGLALTGPASALALPLVLSVAFVVARAIFAAGYARGAAARSLGFALTFYPTVGGLLLLAGRLIGAAR